MISDGILALILADSTRHRYHLASSVFTRSLKKHSRRLKRYMLYLAVAFLSANHRFAINNNLIINSESSTSSESRSALYRSPALLQKYASTAVAVTYRLNEGKHSRESVISIIAPRKRNRTRKIFIFCTAVNDESNRGNVPTSVSSF